MATVQSSAESVGKQANKKISYLNLDSELPEHNLLFDYEEMPNTCSMAELTLQQISWLHDFDINKIDFTHYELRKSNHKYKAILYNCDMPLDHSIHGFFIRSGFTRVFDYYGNEKKRVYVYIRRTGK